MHVCLLALHHLLPHEVEPFIWLVCDSHGSVSQFLNGCFSIKYTSHERFGLNLSLYLDSERQKPGYFCSADSNFPSSRIEV